MEAYFEAARVTAPVPSGALTDRVLKDAERMAAAELGKVTRTGRRGFLPGIFRGLGGWPSAAGLVAATLTGVWIGFAAPDRVSEITGTFGADADIYDLGDLLPGYGDLVLEEG